MLLSAPPLILRIMQEITYLDTSFPVIHKVDNVGIFVLLQFKNKSDTVISHINISSKEQLTNVNLNNQLFSW